MAEKKKKLSVKEAKYIKGRIEGKSGTDAAIDAGMGKKRKSAKELSSQLLKKPHIKEALDEAMESLGITPRYILEGYKNLKEFNEKEIQVPMGAGDNSIINSMMRNPQVAHKATESLAAALDIVTKRFEVTPSDSTSKEDKMELAKQIVLALKNPEQLLKE